MQFSHPASSPSHHIPVITHTGTSIFTSSKTAILHGLPSNVTSRSSADGNGLILSLTPPSGGPATACLNTTLGEITASRYLALSRTSLWWMSPAWGSPADDDALPAETQFLLLQLEDGTCALMLPLIDNGKFRATLCSATTTSISTSNANLGICIESGAATVTASSFKNALYIASGKDPYELVARGVAAAAALSGTAMPRSTKSVPPLVEKFAWCTWDSFYSRVSAAGLDQGLASLVVGGTPPRGIIIDDGWQMTDVDVEYRHEGAAPAAASQLQAVEEAVVELLAGPGDQSLDALKGEHQLQHEAEEEEEKEQVYGNSSAAANGVSEGAPASTSKTQNFNSFRNMLRRAMSSLEAALLHAGKHVLDSSASDSFIVRTFSYLATGPLRASLLRFYAHSTEHTRRLISLEANCKFSSPDASIPKKLDATANTNTNAFASLSSGGGDLAAVVASIKSKYGVQYVYAWHAMHGFWGGLCRDKTNSAMAKYNPTLLMPVPTASILAVDPAVAWVQPVLSGVCLPLDPTALHRDMHAYLAACGVDGVKVDVQGTIGLAGSGIIMATNTDDDDDNNNNNNSMSSTTCGSALSAVYHQSLESSISHHFPGNHLINCMCHSTDDLYNMSTSNLARCSDDFYPQRPASHTSHIANCAFNSVFIGEIAIPDYDMFHSKHPAAALHAAARAVSGGPVYVSDRPGHHDFDVLKRLVFRDGSVLRALLPGRPTSDCLFSDVSHDGATVLKVWNANAVNGVVGVFNVQGSAFSRQHRSFRTHDSSPPVLTAVVRASDVPTLQFSGGGGGSGNSGLCVMYSDRLGTMTVVDVNGGGGDDKNDDDEDDENENIAGIVLEVAPNGGCDVVTVCPVFCSVVGNVLFAAIGLVNMLNSGGALQSCRVSQNNSTTATAFILELRGEGEFLAYCSHKPISVTVGGKVLEQFEYEESVAALKFTLVQQNEENEAIAVQECIVYF